MPFEPPSKLAMWLHALALALLRPFGLTLWRILVIEGGPRGEVVSRRWRIERLH